MAPFLTKNFKLQQAENFVMPGQVKTTLTMAPFSGMESLPLYSCIETWKFYQTFVRFPRPGLPQVTLSISLFPELYVKDNFLNEYFNKY